ncbi:SGNH/GDSL hydrolase family protein [Denitrificimonas caeni]|uniref:SGNH/GDSL hydrolase family protein n=1 Tax=Denitrificimonas caeni TaxID=521720 RepID=UPI00196447D0|nr:SGNH/GDSL hydrolase family protein [Denitrificimonas caeni]
MRGTLILMALAPVLLWQGRQVRRSTLRLPEAAGSRHGCLGRGQPLRLLVLGDSAAAGVGVANQDQALVGQLIAQLSTDYQVSWQLLAKSGLTSQQLLHTLDSLCGQQYDSVVLSIGVNDVIAGTSDTLWLAQLQSLRDRLNTEFKVQHIIISAIPPMQHFVALPWPLNDYLGRRARRLNRLTEQMADNCGDLTFLSVDLGISSQMLAADGFHPSALAYSVWAEHLATQILNFSPQ